MPPRTHCCAWHALYLYYKYPLIVIPHDTATVRAHIAQEDPDVRTGSLLYRGSALSSRQPRFRPSNLYNLTTHAQGGTGGWPTKTRGTWPNRSIYAYGVIARRARNEGRRTAVVLRRPVFERRAGVKCAIWRAPHALTFTSSPRQERFFFWPPFFQYNKPLLRQKTGGACLHIPRMVPS